MKELFSIFTSPLGLPINPLWEYIILAVVEAIAHKAAWEISPSGSFGSLIFWGAKFAVTISVWAVLYGLIVAAKFVIAHWIWFTLGTATITLSGIVVLNLMKNRNISHTQ